MQTIMLVLMTAIITATMTYLICKEKIKIEDFSLLLNKLKNFIKQK
jgi:hypothetical protein